jgi:hypothetical protein
VNGESASIPSNLTLTSYLSYAPGIHFTNSDEIESNRSVVFTDVIVLSHPDTFSVEWSNLTKTQHTMLMFNKLIINNGNLSGCACSGIEVDDLILGPGSASAGDAKITNSV